MTTRELIFSNERSVRIKRHLLFWLVWWVHFSFLHAVLPYGKPEISYLQNLPFTFSEATLLMLPQFLFVYPLLYFILPRYLIKEKYVFAIVWIFLFNILEVVVLYNMNENINRHVLGTFLPEKYMRNTQRPQHMSIVMAFLSTFKASGYVAAVAAGIKLVKHFYIKEQHNLKLQKENTEAQLQLLTAQVHPHFLFNTLNNIYSRAQTESPESAKMIMELSHLLRFVMDEGRMMRVPLENELQMITDYINLEKMRYDEKLDLHLSLPDKSDHLVIAPLLLLPFIENAFKHGASKMIHKPWINLKISLHDNRLVMKLMNGRRNNTQTPLQQGRQGIGLENVKKRLELLYEDKHSLQINEDAEVFIVNLSLELSKEENNTKVQVLSNKTQAYA